MCGCEVVVEDFCDVLCWFGCILVFDCFVVV